MALQRGLTVLKAGRSVEVHRQEGTTMPTYHVHSRIAHETLYRIDAETPEEAVALMYQAGHQASLPVIPDAFMEPHGFRAIQHENTIVEVHGIMDTQFIGTAEEPIRDESFNVLSHVDLSEPEGIAHTEPAQFAIMHDGVALDVKDED